MVVAARHLYVLPSRRIFIDSLIAHVESKLLRTMIESRRPILCHIRADTTGVIGGAGPDGCLLLRRSRVIGSHLSLYCATCA